VIESLTIEGLGVIETAEIEPHPGLTVLTGETGAGKTMVLSGLSLVLGGRPDPGAVRPGAPRAAATATVHLDPADPVLARVAEAGGQADDGAVILVRTVSAEGRSRAHAGGTTVPAQLLAEIADHLVTVHGQADQRRLLRGDRQRDLLDAYADRRAGIPMGAGPLAAYRAARAQWAADVGERDRLLAARELRLREAELVRHGLAEIEAADPQRGEDAALAAEQNLLTHAEELAFAVRDAHDALAGDAGASVTALSARAAAGLAHLELHDPALAALTARVREVALLAGDVAADLASYLAGTEPDPVRLAAIGARRDTLARLTRRWAPVGVRRDGGVDDADGGPDLLDWAADARARLAALADDDEQIAVLEQRCRAARHEVGGLARSLAEHRRAAADALCEAVSAELSALAMPRAVLSARLPDVAADREAPLAVRGPDDVAGDTWLLAGPSGTQSVELLLTPHPGAPARPLDEGASGGELSRVMLAVEVVAADAAPTPTFVFDEIDAGIGGATALEVGRRLAALARRRQVLVVTHLAQVAAYADRHLVVTKDSDGAVTRSGIREVGGPARIAELARMLGGHAESDAAREHAAELLSAADADRAAADRPSAPRGPAAPAGPAAPRGPAAARRTRRPR
jgi:DNA repair protein RecN (Recombination protein N)